MEASNSITMTPTGAIEAKLGSAHVRPTKSGGSNEEMDQAHIIDNGKFMAQSIELNMYKSGALGGMNWIRRLFSWYPSACLGVLDEYTKRDFETITGYTCNAASVGPCDLSILTGYLTCWHINCGLGDSRARARRLQFRDALNDPWRWRKRGCRDGNVDIDVQTI